MFADLLELTVGADRARDLMQVLAVDTPFKNRGGKNGQGAKVPTPLIAHALHFLLFEDLLKRSPSTLAITGEAMQAGDVLTIDHSALATLDVPYMGRLARGRHHLGHILEPLGFVQVEAHSLPQLSATAHIYRCQLSATVPDFVVMEVHGMRLGPEFEAAARSIFSDTPSPNHVRVQAHLARLKAGEELNLDQAAEFLQGVFAWFGRQHVPPLKDAYQTLCTHSPISAWMAHEGQGISHISLRVSHLSVAMDMQLRQGRELQLVKTSLDQTTKLVGLVPDRGLRPFRDSTNRIVQMEVPIANLAFMERSDDSDPHFEPGLF